MVVNGMSDSHQPWFSIGSTYWGGPSAKLEKWRLPGSPLTYLDLWWHMTFVPQSKLDFFQDSNTTTSKVSIFNDTHNYSIICRWIQTFHSNPLDSSLPPWYGPGASAGVPVLLVPWPPPQRHIAEAEGVEAAAITLIHPCCRTRE